MKGANMSTVLRETDFFKTSELPLAATLICCGFTLDHLETIDSHRLNFVFKRDDEIDKVIQEFWADTSLVISPKRFFYVLKELKSRIYAERRQIVPD